MAKHVSEDIRTIALVGHADSGKTTLADMMLKVGGTANRAGSVTDKSSLSDFDEEEQERQHSIYATVLRTECNGKHIQIVDTPGYPDFLGEVATGTAPADVAVLCVSAAAGIGVNTRRAWDIAEKYGMPRAIIITKIDSDSGGYDKVLASVQETFGSNCVPVLSPVDAGPNVSGVTDLLAPGADGREALVEAVAESDDALMEKYLDDQELTEEEVAGAFGKAITAGILVPVLCCSAAKEVGVAEVLNVIATYFPAPSGRINLSVNKAGEPEEEAEAPAIDGPFSAFVFKTLTDAFVGKIAFFRVVSGSISSTNVTVVRTGKSSRVTALLLPQGKEQEHADSLVAGDIGAVAKIEDILVGDTLATEDVGIEYGKVELPLPMVALAVSPKSRADEQRISGSLHKLVEEDPSFVFEIHKKTNQLLVRGMSALHLDVVLSRLKRRYNVEVDREVPKIAYLETITGESPGHHRHKKQTGGRGQFAEVHLAVEPNERGAGLDFIDETVGGSIPKNFLPRSRRASSRLWGRA